ncbi:hypothetical protein [Streptomyces sp. N35]|uniref:hypothetical protein n=1 Tax=Streptomyces sp. N35 TaxID=2795730 RepID=UPI0018F44EA9|nr:hypothetical protein [Streptomyces sp. N35]
MGHRGLGRTTSLCVAALLLTACSGSGGDGPRAPEPPNSPAPSGSRTGGPSEPAPDSPFTPDPDRVPHTAADALRLARKVAASPDQYGPGYTKSSPYESDPAQWAVLDATCVWQRERLPKNVLASITTYGELPAADGRGPVRVSSVVTVHREVDGADWEMARTLEEALRCPDQELRAGEWIKGLFSEGMALGQGTNAYADDSISENGEYHSERLGGPYPYNWSQARIGPVTVASVIKGGKGHTEQELNQAVEQGFSAMVVRAELELGGDK